MKHFWNVWLFEKEWIKFEKKKLCRKINQNFKQNKFENKTKPRWKWTEIKFKGQSGKWNRLNLNQWNETEWKKERNFQVLVKF